MTSLSTKENGSSTRIADVSFAFFLGAVVFGCTVAIWDRHLLVDDYAFRSFAHDISRDAWQPLLQSPFPLRQLGILLIANLSNAIPDYEFLVRLALGFVHYGNSLLVGWFLAGLTRSKWLGQVSALLFACFFPASEATLWLAQVCSHGIGTTLFLLALNCFRIGSDSHQYKSFGMKVVAIVLVAVGLQFSELPFPLVGLFPFVSIYRSWGVGSRTRIFRSALTGSVWLVVALTVGVLHLGFFTGQASADMQARGGISIEPMAVLNRYVGYGPRLYWLLFNPAFGGGLTQASWSIALQQVLTTSGGILGALLVLGAGAVWAWNRERTGNSSATHAQTAWVTTGFGIIIALASLTPGALLGGQIFEYRMLYVTGMGCAYIGAGLLGLVRHMAGRFIPRFVGLSSIAALFIACCGSIVYIGHEQVYAWRGQTDRQQIQALLAAVPPEHFPVSNIFFVPVSQSPALWADISPAERAVDRLLFGVLEIPYAAEAALRMAYRRTDIGVLTSHHWSNGLSIKALDDPQALEINGTTVELSSLIMFTIRDRQVILGDSLVLTDETGAIMGEYSLPLAHDVGSSGVSFETMTLAATP